MKRIIMLVKLTTPLYSICQNNVHYVLAFFLSDVMSLAPKIDKIQDVIRRDNYQCISIVETWLHSHIHDDVGDLQGYNLIRRDRGNGQHGVYIFTLKTQLPFK